MQIVSVGNNMHEVPNHVFLKREYDKMSSAEKFLQQAKHLTNLGHHDSQFRKEKKF